MLKQINERVGMASKELKAVYSVSVLYKGYFEQILDIMVFQDRKFNKNGSKNCVFKIKANIPLFESHEYARTVTVFNSPYRSPSHIVDILKKLGFPISENATFNKAFEEIARMTLGNRVKISPKNFHVTTIFND